jgi:hypothetical protein
LTNSQPYGIINTTNKERGKNMVVMINGMYVGTVDATQYSVKELQNAGFTVIID